VLAVLTSIFVVASLGLVTRNRNLATQIMHLQQNRGEPVQTTTNPLHQGDGHTYEEAVVGQEAIYIQAKFEKANATFEVPYATLESGA
jgi:hypothetical protein